MESKFKATIDIENFDWRTGIIPFRFIQTNSPVVSRLIEKYKEVIEKNNYTRSEYPELYLQIEFLYEKRSIKANSLMWAIYRIQAFYMNKELKSVKQITPEELYENDMADYATKHRIKSPKDSAQFFRIVLTKDKGRIKSEKEIDGFVYFEVWETSSFWNTKKMAEFLQIKLYELEQAGITRLEDGNLDKVFDDFEKWKTQEGINESNDQNG